MEEASQVKKLITELALVNSQQENGKRFSGGGILARNTIWNLVGQGAPLLVALFAFPLLIKGLGTDRFGVLTLAWSIVGYFGLFDFGLGRAITKLVSEKLGSGESEDIPVLIWTALALMGLLGLIGALVVASISGWLAHDILKIPQALQGETINSFYLLAFSIPIVVSANCLRGVLEAFQRFDLVNKVRIPLGILTFLGPLLVLPFTNDLFAVIGFLVAARFLTCGVLLMLCLQVVPGLRQKTKPETRMVWPLISFGSWITVSGIISPVMVYMDRFLIGAIVSLTAVTYYTTPYEVITKLGIFPAAIVGVLFPAFSLTMVVDSGRTERLFYRGINYIFIALFPITLIIVTMANEGLSVWLGEEFAENSTFVLQWLAVGVFVNSLARVPSALVQAGGRPDLRAKMHLMELPIYIFTLWWLLGDYGIKGAAVAWVVRIGIDTLILFFLVHWLLPNTKVLLRNTVLKIIIAWCVFIMAGYTAGLFIKVIFLVGMLTVFILMGWRWLLDVEGRRLVKGVLRFLSL